MKEELKNTTQSAVKEVPFNGVATPKEEVKEEVFEQQSKPILQVMTEEDAYISDRMKSQPKTLDEIALVRAVRYAPGEHRLSLPNEFKEYGTRFAFRWINKKKRAIDDAILKGWVIINRSLFKDIAKSSPHLFSTSGAVEKGDAILACISLDMANSIRRAPGKKSNDAVNAVLSKGKEPLPKGQSGFYKPEVSDADSDAGLQEGRDF
jgi:hypothetical protein